MDIFEKCYAPSLAKELKEAGLIQGEILPPKVRYCINRENWAEARALFGDFFRDCVVSTTSSCCE